MLLKKQPHCTEIYVPRGLQMFLIYKPLLQANHGNCSKTYDIVSIGGGVKENNFYFRDNSSQANYLPQSIINTLPQTTNPVTLIGQEPLDTGNVFGTFENNRQTDGVIRQQL